MFISEKDDVAIGLVGTLSGIVAVSGGEGDKDTIPTYIVGPGTAWGNTAIDE